MIPSQATQLDGITYVERNRRLSTGELVRVRITGADIYDLFGETVSLPN